MLDKTAKTIIVAAARGAGVAPDVITAMLAVADGTFKKTSTERSQRALLTQMEKADQLGVSRFTVRKLVAAGKLHPIELLPGLLRYPARELAEE